MKIRSTQQALDEAQRLIALFPGLWAVVQDIAEIQSIDAAAEAAEQRKANADTALAQAKQDTADEIDRAAAIKQKALDAAAQTAKDAADTAEAAKSTANKQLIETQNHAERLLADAKQQADSIVSEAKNIAAGIVADTADAKKQLAMLKQQCADSQNDLDELNSQIQMVQVHRDQVKAALGL